MRRGAIREATGVEYRITGTAEAVGSHIERNRATEFELEMERLMTRLKRASRFAAAVGVAGAMASSVLLCVSAPGPSADPCPDVGVVFARGSGEPPGLGGIGGPFVDELRGQIGGRSLAVYPVN